MMTRRVFFLGLIAYGLLTSLFYRIVNLIDRIGWTDAAVYVFSISVIVWVAVYIGLELIIEADDDESVGELDEAVGIIGLLLCSIPYAPLAWLGLTILTGWLVITTVPQTTLHRGALILLATTFPMLWSRVIFKFLSGPILLVDAWIVAKLLGTSNEGTHIEFVDKSGFLEVSPACSSWANISLVLLTWMVISQYQRRRWQVVDLGWCALVVLTVVAINTIRMAMMGISEEHYFLIHGTLGSTIISWMIVGVTVALCLWGTRSDGRKFNTTFDPDDGNQKIKEGGWNETLPSPRFQNQIARRLRRINQKTPPAARRPRPPAPARGPGAP